ncbi:hypothetical protein ACNVED_05465 [Legionella sp. D16C41]|uniref:hypothetical protein n=1 Tax=Legionella sp. D16C41 TaxID=3402688 RepID=UPI003AF6BB77
MRKQVIYLITDNQLYASRQYEEISKLFKRYDIDIITTIKIQNELELRLLLEEKWTDNKEVLAALKIHNTFTLESNKQFNSVRRIVKDCCILHAYQLKNGKIICNKFNYSTLGFWDDAKIQLPCPHSEFFYKKFILKKSNLTYSDLECRGMKNTSQAMAVSKFICNKIHYARPTNLNFNPQEQQSSIDFCNDPAIFIRKNSYFNNPVAKQYGITNLFYIVLNRGVFFKSAKNRREKNYWCPPLNAGLPLTPKRDLIHELTYMAHDFGHFLIPDLLYTGKHTVENQQIYIIYRMMSEAFTLVLADMMFVDSLKKSGFEYDYSKRKIYPLFEEFDIDLRQTSDFLKNIKKILSALVQFCLKGNDSGLYELSKKYRHGSNNLELFKEKYMKFFCEDFKWTKHNYQCFKANSKELKKWWKLVKPLRDEGNLAIDTIEEFSLQLSTFHPDDLIDNIFSILFQRVGESLQYKTECLDNFGKRQRKALFKYMMGQLLLFVRFEEVIKEAKDYQKMIIDYLVEIKEEIKMENIQFCKTVQNDFIALLLDKNFINYDDAATFKDVFPVFEPCFAFYDEKKEFYRDLSLVAYESIYAA